MGYMVTDDQTFTLGGTVGKYERVKMSGANVVRAGLTDRGIGTATRGGVAGDSIAVRLDKAPSVFMKAAGPIAAGADVFSAAAGKVNVSASTAYKVGVAKEAATADGDVFEVIPHSGGDVAVA